MYKKICEYCHKEFDARVKSQRFCSNDHYTKCCICGKTIKLNSQQLRNSKTLSDFVCSKECRIQKSVNQKYIINNGNYRSEESKNKIKQTNLERYGGTGFASKQIKEKYKKTCIERYGTLKHSLNLQKRFKTNLERYNSISPLGNKDIQNNIKENNKKKYNCEYPFQNEEIHKKAILNCINTWQNNKDEILSKIKNTNLEKYGKEFAIQNNNIKNKIKQTKLERYGDPNYTNWKKANETKKKRYGTHTYNNLDKIKQTNLDRYGISYTCQLPQVIEKNKHMISNINRHFKKLLDDYNIKSNYEFKLNNMSYDLKIENTNILIELNPSYTHQSTGFRYFGKSQKDPLNKNYHIEKTKNALNNGYRCIHVFDWDNWNKIINLLKPKEKIYARNCNIKQVSDIDINKFLNEYHLQGTCRGQSIKLGLYYNNELIQVMSFGKPRYNKNYQYELLRLCTSPNYIVIGGSEKLFNYFIKNYKANSIISYCDNAKFKGDVYINLHFKLKSFGQPALHWSKGKEQITNNLLNQRGYDQLFNTNYGKGTSNYDLMIQNNWKGIYDCGQSVYIWNKE